MRKPIFISSLLIASLVSAQTRQIQFETGNVASVLEKAKKENKLIFIDAYTSWCGPCKWMAKNIFTNDTVADYYNKNFVNYKLDMEKGEGIEMAKKYTVNCYPNLLFINSNGELVHRGAGGMPAKEFIEFGANSQQPDKTFSAQQSNFEKTGFNETNILSYVQLMSNSCLNPSPAVNTYIISRKPEDLMLRANWVLLRDHVRDYQNPANQYFAAHIPEFEKKFGKDTVAEKLTQLGANYFEKYVMSMNLDQEAYAKAKKDFLALKWPNADLIIFNADLISSQRFDKPKYYSLVAGNYLKYYNNDASALNSMAWAFYTGASDKEQLKAAVEMAKRACELKNEYAHLDTYAALLFKLGEFKKAEKIANEAIETAKKQKYAEEEYAETVGLLKAIKANLK